MTTQKKEEVINYVIGILLPLKVKERGMVDALQEAVNREAADVAIHRVGGTAKTEPANYAAVTTIVAKVGSQTVADFAVLSCLEIYNAHKNEFFSLTSNDALDAAARMLTFASTDTKEKVIVAVAEKGWYGRIEALARKYLNRGLTANEVMALVDAYVNVRGIRSEEQEKELFFMAKIHAPEIVSVVQNKIARFVKEFENSWD